jgi:hypothetical protein
VDSLPGRAAFLQGHGEDIHVLFGNHPHAVRIVQDKGLVGRHLTGSSFPTEYVLPILHRCSQTCQLLISWR